MSGTDRIEKSIEVKAPIAKVWRAISDYKQFGEWFRVNLQDPFEEGKPSKGHITYPGYEDLIMTIKVNKIQPQNYFSFYWHPYAIDRTKDYSAEEPTLVEFRLEEIPDGTKIFISESGFDKLPAERRDEAFRMNDGGWTQQAKNIEEYVGKAN